MKKSYLNSKQREKIVGWHWEGRPGNHMDHSSSVAGAPIKGKKGTWNEEAEIDRSSTY